MDAAKVRKLVNGPGGFAPDMGLPTVIEMMRRGSLGNVGKGQRVTRRGQSLARLGICLIGSIRLNAHTNDGREMLVHTIRPGDCWGVHPCLGGYEETNDTFAENDATVLLIRPEVVADLMWTHREFQEAMVGVLCARLNMVSTLSERYGVWNARQRVIWRLLVLSGNLEQTGASNEVTLSQDSLADMVHLSRQRTNFVLRGLVADGLISLKYGGVRLADLPGLRSEIGA